MKIHVKTVIPEDDPLLDLLGREPCRWIYGELWLRTRETITTGAGPLYGPLREQVAVMLEGARARVKAAIDAGGRGRELEKLLTERETLEDLTEYLARTAPVAELVEDVPARPATGPLLKAGEEPLEE